MNLQWGGSKFIQFWYSSFALISAGESIGVSDSCLHSLLSALD